MTQISLNLAELEGEYSTLRDFLAQPDAYSAPDYTSKNKRFSELETLVAKAKEREASLDKRYSASKNSQYGSFWITDGSVNRKWKDDKGRIPKGFNRGRTL